MNSDISSDTDLVIRPYQADDTQDLTDIWFEASRLVHGFLGEAKLREHRQLVSDIYLPKAETWVACLEGRQVGFMSLLDSFVGGLFVSPEVQNRGLGRALIDHGLRQKGALQLDVYALNQIACRFYRKLGFVETERRSHDKEGLPFEEISMTLTG